MKWIKATEKSPPPGVIKREISTGEVIPNQHIYRQDVHCIIMSNAYDSVGINGREIFFNDIEWLDETLKGGQS